MRATRKLGRTKSGKWVFIGDFSILILFLLIPAVAHAKPTVNCRTEYYEIRGSTAAELKAQMRARGLRDVTGAAGDAQTKWHIDWHYRYNNTRNGCRIASVNVTVNITIIYPRWVNRPVGSSELKAKWDRFIAALTIHEEGHRDLAVDAAARIERAIGMMRERSNCQDLERAANALGHSISGELRAESARYDAQTQHGLTQGTRFP